MLPIIMPENWMFTGFLVFAVFGPIVRAEMRYYQSHLLTMVRPKDGGDKVEIETGVRKASTKKKRQKVEVKVEPGVNNRPSPTKNRKFTVNQELQMIAIEQSKVLAKRCAQNELNDRIVAMHTKTVAGKKALIEEVGSSLSCILHLTVLVDLSLCRSSWFLTKNSRAHWMRDLTRCEMAMIESMGDKADHEHATNNN